MEREAAAVGCFITLDPAPAKHRADAKSAGRVHVAGQAYDRLQLWSMVDYFDQQATDAAGIDRPVHGTTAESVGTILRAEAEKNSRHSGAAAARRPADRRRGSELRRALAFHERPVDVPAFHVCIRGHRPGTGQGERD